MQQITDLDTAQRTDDRALYLPLREHRNAVETWPLLRGEKPLPAGCDQQGRYVTRRVDTAGMGPAECCTEMGADNEDADDRFAGAGAVVVPAVVAFALACAALVAFLGGKL
ncbi:MAG: hypothetical protein ACRC1H_09120 [Caldilineaceae bacterium]